MSEFNNCPVLLVSLATPEGRSRSVSPQTQSPTRELRGIRLFRAISKRLSRRRCVSYEDDSTDSEPSSSSEGQSESGSGSGMNSPDSMRSKQCSESSLRKVFQSLNINGQTNERRSSESNSDISSASSKKKSNNNTPKKILRQPVSYTYVRGMSGLPTIRVPRSNGCIQNNYYSSAYNR